MARVEPGAWKYGSKRQPADWARHLPGVTLSEMSAGAVRLALADPVDSDDVLHAAMGAGRVLRFSFERRPLSEVFREAVDEILPVRRGRSGSFPYTSCSPGADEVAGPPRTRSAPFRRPEAATNPIRVPIAPRAGSQV